MQWGWYACWATMQCAQHLLGVAGAAAAAGLPEAALTVVTKTLQLRLAL